MAQAPAQQPDGTEKIFICDLVQPGKVASYFVCSAKEVSTQRNGQSFLKLSLRDASGEIKAIHWDADEHLLDELESGDVVRVAGSYSEHPQYGPQLKVDQMKVLHQGEYDPETLVQVAPTPYEELRERVADLVAGVTEPHLHALLVRALNPDRQPGSLFMTAPAAVRMHHAYRHGLLEHSLQVAETAAAIADLYRQVQRDIVVTGALLHDIGKTEAYAQDLMAPQFTDAGRLQGEIVLGHRILTDLIREQPDFPSGLSALLQHVLIAHHGMKEKGSPAVPMTREAMIVHYCDDMTARIAAFDEAEAETRKGDRWTSYSRMHETMLFVDEAPDPPPAHDEAAEGPAQDDDREGLGDGPKESVGTAPGDGSPATPGDQPDRPGPASADRGEPQTLLDL